MIFRSTTSNRWKLTRPRACRCWTAVIWAISGPLQDGSFASTRLWQLTNTRYVLADASMESVLNQFGEPKNSFRTVMRMDLVVKIGIIQFEDAGDLTVKTNSQGALALLSSLAPLPRAKLFANWQVMDDSAALHTLASPQFDPEKTVLLAKETPVSQAPGQPDADPGTVEISQYESKDLILASGRQDAGGLAAQ
jgi:hypothetical protein